MRLRKAIAFFIILTLFFTVKPSIAFAPAIALLNPAVLGSVVVAGGVMAGAAAHYAPAVYEAGQVAVDTMANFSRILYQAEKFALTSGVQYAVGRLEQATLDLGNVSGDAWNYIKSHLPDLPTLAGVWSAIHTDTPAQYNGSPFIEAFRSPSQNVYLFSSAIFPVADTYVIGLDSALARNQVTALYRVSTSSPVITTSTNCYYDSNTALGWLETGSWMTENPASIKTCSGTSPYTVTTWSISTAPAYDVQKYTPPAIAIQSPTAISDAISDAIAINGTGVAVEIDKVIAANPGAVIGVTPWTSADSESAKNTVISQGLKDAAIVAKAASEADPTNTALKIAATEAQVASDIAEIENTPLPPVALPTIPSFPAAVSLPAIPIIETFDFTAPISAAMTQTITNLQSHEPFSTFIALPSMLSSLTAVPHAPVIDITLPFVGEFHIDLSPWDGVATMIRAGLSFMVLVGLSFFIIKVWV